MNNWTVGLQSHRCSLLLEFGSWRWIKSHIIRFLPLFPRHLALCHGTMKRPCPYRKRGLCPDPACSRAPWITSAVTQMSIKACKRFSASWDQAHSPDLALSLSLSIHLIGNTVQALGKSSPPCLPYVLNQKGPAFEFNKGLFFFFQYRRLTLL